jgi:hypothetical protein
MYNKSLLEECDKEENGLLLLLLLPVWKSRLNRSAQCHVLAHAPPDRRPNDKYPVNNSPRSVLCKNVSLQCCLEAAVVHIQYVRCQMCVYTDVLHSVETLIEQKKLGQQWLNATCQGNLSHAILETRARATTALLFTCPVYSLLLPDEKNRRSLGTFQK